MDQGPRRFDQPAPGPSAGPSTSQQRKQGRVPVLAPPASPADLDYPARARIIHPGINAAQQFQQAFALRPLILEMCSRCGRTDQHRREDCQEVLDGCEWICCPHPETHNFPVCPYFLRRCANPGCRLRGHQTPLHQDVLYGFDYCLDDYVREWERLADSHFYARARRAYSPWGCYEVPQVLDHLSLNEVYFYSVGEWNVMCATFEICESVLKARDRIVTLVDRTALDLESQRRDRHLHDVLRMEVEANVLGRPMTEQERDYFMFKYELRPINDPQLLSHLIVYLRLKEKNERLSLYAPVRRYFQEERRVPKPFPPWFDPKKPRTKESRDLSGQTFKTCAECRDVVTHELHPLGYCFVCGHERQPPAKDAHKKFVDPTPIERELARRLRGFGLPGTPLTRAEAPAELRANVALPGDILQKTSQPDLPGVEPREEETKRARRSSRQRERDRRRREQGEGSSRDTTRSPPRHRDRAESSSTRRTDSGRSRSPQRRDDRSRSPRRSTSPRRTRTGTVYRPHTPRDREERRGRSPVRTRSAKERLGEPSRESVFERLGEPAKKPSAFERLGPVVKVTKEQQVEAERRSLIDSLSKSLRDRLGERPQLPPSRIGLRIRQSMLAKTSDADLALQKLAKKLEEANWTDPDERMEDSPDEDDTYLPPHLAEQAIATPSTSKSSAFKIPKVPARREEDSSKRAVAPVPAPEPIAGPSTAAPVQGPSSYVPGLPAGDPRVQVVPLQPWDQPKSIAESAYPDARPAGESDDEDFLELGIDPYEWTPSDLERMEEEDIDFDEDEIGRPRVYRSAAKKKKSKGKGSGKKSK
jgi:hypothetical protein